MAAIGQPQNQKENSPRPDPTPGDLFGPISMTDLENRDPNKHYVFVARDKNQLNEYRRMGYKPEVGEEGGVHVAGDSVDLGREIECSDHVLMSVSKERHQQIVEHGAFGAGGQKRVDQIENLIIDKKAIGDHFRGPTKKNGGRYFRVRNETEELEEE